MQTTDLIQFMRDGVSDQDNTAVTAEEYSRTVVQAVRDYSRLSPDLAELPLATTSGTTDYAFPAGVIAVLKAVDAAGVAQAFTTFGQKVRFTTAPGTGTSTLTVQRYHQPDVDGNYPTVPDEHLDYAGDLGVAGLLERFADDIARTSDVSDGATMERWPHNARTLLRSAVYKRSAVADALEDSTPFAG